MAFSKGVGRAAVAAIPAAGPALPFAVRRLEPLGWAVLHVALFMLVFAHTREDEVLRGFVRLSYQDSGRVLSGAVPYRDVFLEYPPGTLLFMLAPRLFAAGLLHYRTLFFFEAALLDGIVIATVVMTARGANRPGTRAALAYTLMIVLLGPLAAYRLDLAPTALTALALLAWQRDRPVAAAALLAAGAATKGYPILLLPPLLIDTLARGQRRQLRRMALAFGAVLAVFASPVIYALLAHGLVGILQGVRFQTDRHTQVESIWATFPLLWHLLSGYAVGVAVRERALVILGPGDALGAAGTPALALAALYTYALWWRVRLDASLRQGLMLIGAALLVLAAAVLGKVLSPQYVLWVMPFMALLPGRSRATAFALGAFVAALPLTQWVYPMHYGELVKLLTPQSVAVLAARNLLLVGALIVLAVALWRLPAHERSGASQDLL